MRIRDAIRIALFVSVFMSLCHAPVSAQDIVEAIVAVVDDEIILKSELEEQMYLVQVQVARQITDEKELNDLRTETLDRMIDERLLLAQAERETIAVSDEEIEAALDQAVQRLRSRFSTEEELISQLEMENTSIALLRNLYREDIVRQITVDRLIDKEIRSSAQVSWGEVREYFNNNQDEIPDVGEKVELSHIFIGGRQSKDDREAALSKINIALGEIRAGKDFADAAREYSDDPSAEAGGALGAFGRGDMVPEFEDAAFALDEGEISEVVETRFGFHIIKVDEISDDGRIRVSHILALVEPSTSGMDLARARADSVMELFSTGETFEDLVTKFSDDEATKSSAGYIGWVELDAVPPEMSEVAASLGTNEISEPIGAAGGYHLVIITDRTEKHRPTYEEIQEELREALKAQKMAAKYDEWVQQLRAEIYVDVRLNEVFGDGS